MTRGNTMRSSEGHYIYHRFRNDLSGHILYPLNQLKDTYPKVYATRVKNYDGREGVMKMRIPFLDCLWNDVLHFSPVHPAKIHAARVAAGFPRRPRTYFEVNPTEMGFNAENAIIFLHQHLELGKPVLKEEDFESFNPQALARFTEVPDATKAYYGEMYRKGTLPLVYLRCGLGCTCIAVAKRAPNLEDTT